MFANVTPTSDVNSELAFPLVPARVLCYVGHNGLANWQVDGWDLHRNDVNSWQESGVVHGSRDRPRHAGSVLVMIGADREVIGARDQGWIAVCQRH